MQAKLVMCVVLVAVVAFASAKECKNPNECGSEAGMPICATDYSSSTNATKSKCMQCNPAAASKDCQCGINMVCWNVRGDSDYGMCKAADTAMVGQACSPLVNAANLKKDENEKLFCGQAVEKESKYYVVWSGSCVQGTCQRCEVESTAGCGDNRRCNDGSGYSTYFAGPFSWSLLGANALSFTMFVTFPFVAVASIAYAIKVCRG